MNDDQREPVKATGVLDTAAASNRRRAFRVDDTVDLTVRVLESAEFTAEAKRLRHRQRNGGRGGPDAPRRPTDRTLDSLERTQPAVHAWILYLESRLAAVPGPDDSASMQAGKVLPGLGSQLVVDLSESGIGFPLIEPLESGTLLALEIALSSLEQPLELVGEIVRSVERDGAYSGSVRFRELDPADRETLVRHIFAVQRQQLRRRRLD